MADLHETEVALLLTLADFVEVHDRPMSSDQLLAASGLERAEYVRRLGFLASVGLVNVGRERPLTDLDLPVALTRKGKLRVVAEQAATATLPTPGPRSRLSSLALESPEIPGSASAPG